MPRFGNDRGIERDAIVARMRKQCACPIFIRLVEFDLTVLLQKGDFPQSRGGNENQDLPSFGFMEDVPGAA